ncbi:hypothetical protein [Pendulispora albinea]|uniref:Uncharacterized protein n=1 Tax=Pendulispora albinea TaxID=2741071 RepID=A0ABZ2M5P0_9BACT
MAYEYVGQVCVLVHSVDCPSDLEWERDLPGYIERSRTGATTCMLVYSDGGGPTLMQRNRMRVSREPAFHCPIAIVTRSRIGRGIATAVRWFRPNLGVFSPDQLRAAFEHLNLPASTHDHLAQRIFALRSELSALRGTGIPPRFTSGKFPGYVAGEPSEV